MSKLLENELITITYDGDVAQRTIIPTTIPVDHVQSIDVTSLSESDQQDMRNLIKEYAEYVRIFSSNMYNFETWAEHTKGIYIEPKWRKFKLDKIAE